MFRQFTIAYMGSFDPWRSVDLIVDAFSILQKNHKDIKMLLIGGGGNINTIRKMAGNNRDIVITDWIKSNRDVIAYCKGSDILLMTPRDNIMSKTVSSIKCFEYIACEVPLVVTDTGEHAEWVRKLDVGLVTKPDAAAIAEGIESLMEDKRLYRKLKENCRKSKIAVDYKETRKDFIREIREDLGSA